ncbi:MAG: hypothetical protein J2P29_02760 [Actinobacteria bacterium]|nr:hypothetical protein [Actinomycetota bacterium]
MSDRRKIAGWNQGYKEMALASWADTWARIKTIFAILAPIAATIGLIGMISLLTGAHSGYSTVHIALTLAAFAVVLLVWVVKFAIPLVTRGRLPDGRLLTEVIVRQRLQRRRARNRRERRRRAGL